MGWPSKTSISRRRPHGKPSSVIFGKILLDGFACGLRGEIEVCDGQPIKERFYRAADLPFGANINVVEFVGLEVDSANPGLYGAREGVHDHKACLSHLAMVFDDVE